MTATEKIRAAKYATQQLRSLSAEDRTRMLNAIDKGIMSRQKDIMEANAKDVKLAHEQQISASLLKRLSLDTTKLKSIHEMIASLRAQEDMVYKTVLRRELADGLVLSKRCVPIGTIGMIFESRPDALVQIAILCAKTANSVVLKGGKEAKHSCELFHEIIVDATKDIAGAWIQLLEDRTDVQEMISNKGKDSVDLLVPRGSSEFVSYIMQNASVPVLGHADGICHIYVHSIADIEKTKNIIHDSKLQYPAACNSLECLLIDASLVDTLPTLLMPLVEEGTQFFVDARAAKVLDNSSILYTQEEESAWGVEYADTKLAVRTVDGLIQACEHINTYGSKHTDAIITQDKEVARRFENMLDSSSVFWNCSTRFADGYRYGLGAEVGISTSKIHASGPVGTEGLFSMQWILEGNNDTVAPFMTGVRKFTHKTL